MTATLVYTSSRTEDNAVRIARVAAAGRVAAERKARAARDAARYESALLAAERWVAEIRADGAVEVAFKVCLSEGGKWRSRIAMGHAAAFIARTLVWEDDIEAWGLTAAGETAGSMF